ncbi:hypothetical protein BLOT_009606 [Blomia tropicalis]|nr:hypothetical protein BLOT_009606 [Blomia tropicalis]
MSNHSSSPTTPPLMNGTIINDVNANAMAPQSKPLQSTPPIHQSDLGMSRKLPRRFSLQLLKNPQHSQQHQSEIPESLKFFAKTCLFDINSGTNRTFMNDERNNALLTMAAAVASSARTKSNPTSPIKSISGYMSENRCVTMNTDEDQNSCSMQTQIVITNSSTNNEQTSSQQSLTNNGQQQQLVRSKSLDDLNSLIFPYNGSQCQSATIIPDIETNCTTIGGGGGGGGGNNLMAYPMMGLPTHYSSFNRIDHTYQNITSENTTGLTPPFFPWSSSSGPPSHCHVADNQNLLPPDLPFVGVNNSMKGMSISSHEINNTGNNQQLQTSSLTNSNASTNVSLCDIDNVMKRISSLRV